MLWQAYVTRVRASDAYLRPAYEYQRAPYQNYNVAYAENILLVDPFRPELGRADGGALAARFVTNLARMPVALGEAVSAPKHSWQSALERTNRLLGRHLLPVGVVWVPILGFGALVVAGFVVFIQRRDWMLVSIPLLSVALVCLTPWPEEFKRYLTPIAPFLTIAAILALERLDAALRASGSRRPALLGRLASPAFLCSYSVSRRSRRCGSSVIAIATVPASYRTAEPAVPVSSITGALGWPGSRLPLGLARARTPPRSSPRVLHTNCICRQAFVQYTRLWIPIRSRRIVSSKPFPRHMSSWTSCRIETLSRRYALPAVESHPASWHLVHTVDGTRIFAHALAGDSSQFTQKVR